MNKWNKLKNIIFNIITFGIFEREQHIYEKIQKLETKQKDYLTNLRKENSDFSTTLINLEKNINEKIKELLESREKEGKTSKPVATESKQTENIDKI